MTAREKLQKAFERFEKTLRAIASEPYDPHNSTSRAVSPEGVKLFNRLARSYNELFPDDPLMIFPEDTMPSMVTHPKCLEVLSQVETALDALREHTNETTIQIGGNLEAAAKFQFDWDVFVSHASEDKEPFVKQLADRLAIEGIAVWYDEFALTVGDSLRRSIDKGLSKSRYGIVVLSPRFFAKEWPQKELDGLVARERGGEKVILPIWLDLDHSEVVAHSPMLADRVAAQANEGLDKVTAKLVRVLRPPDHTGRGVTICRITKEQGRQIGKTMSELVGLEYVVQHASDVDTILRRAVRMVVQHYSLIPETALMLGQFTVETDPVAGVFILKGGADIALFAEQLVRGEPPHIPELD